MRFLDSFKKMLEEPWVLSDEGKETKRATHNGITDYETKAKIEDLYEKSGDTFGEFERDIESGKFDIITYEEMPFSTNDIYITHLNVTEDFLYRDKSFATGSFNQDELIPKGSIASKPPKDYTRYPILSQLQAQKLDSRAYFQLANVGSCTRYQGSECRTDQKLYYLITHTSKITDREWYTVVSRCWSLSSIIIVIVPEKSNEKITSFGGKRVKPTSILTVFEKENEDEESISNC